MLITFSDTSEMIKAWKEILHSEDWWNKAIEHLTLSQEKKNELIAQIIANISIQEGDILGSEKSPMVVDAIISPCKFDQFFDNDF